MREGKRGRDMNQIREGRGIAKRKRNNSKNGVEGVKVEKEERGYELM